MQRPKYVYLKPNGVDQFFKHPKTGKLPIPRLDAPDFTAEYHKLLASVANGTLSLPVKVANRKHIDYGGAASVGALARAHFASEEYLRLGPDTARCRRLYLEDCLRTVHPTPMEGGECVAFAEWRIDEVTVDVLRDLRSALQYEDRGRPLKNAGDLAYWRDVRLGAMRILFDWGCDRPYRWVDRDERGREIARRTMTGNPCKRLRPLYGGSEGHRTLEDDDCDTLDAYLLAEGLHVDRIAYGLARYLALRLCDVVRVGAPNVRMITPLDGGEKVRALVFKEWKGSQSKTEQRTNKTRVIPIPAPLWEIIERCPGAMDRPTFIVGPRGRKQNPKQYCTRFSKLCRDAELPAGSTMHGIRKYVGTRMADKGATPHQIAAMLGHQTRKGEVSIKNVLHYTRKADQRRLTDSALGFVID